MKFLPWSSLVLLTLSPLAHAEPTQLVTQLQRIKSELNSDNKINSENCETYFDEVYRYFVTTSPEKLGFNEHAENDREVVQTAFANRLRIEQRVKDLFAKEKLSESCFKSAKKALRVMRFIEEYVGERVTHYPRSTARTRPDVFSGGFPWLQTADSDTKFELQSGDVILSRGDFLSSAAIARMGEADSQFSHLGLVYIKEPTTVGETRETFVFEAHAETGLQATPIDEYLTDMKVRASVRRFQDPEMAKKAAQKMADLIFSAKDRGYTYPYDFYLNLEEHEQFFCSEVVYYGFDEASQHQIQLPLFKSRLNQAGEWYVNKMDFNSDRVFLPGDLEGDPRFSLVAEWRDYSRTRTTRHKDVILTAMYRWMQDYDYRFIPTGETKLLRTVVRTARRWPLFRKYLSDLFPPHIPKNTLEVGFSIEAVASKILTDLEAKDRRFENHFDRRMVFSELLGVVEKLRVTDLENYQRALGGELKLQCSQSNSNFQTCFEVTYPVLIHSHFRSDD